MCYFFLTELESYIRKTEKPKSEGFFDEIVGIVPFWKDVPLLEVNSKKNFRIGVQDLVYSL